jgi:hypothetical protein
LIAVINVEVVSLNEQRQLRVNTTLSGDLALKGGTALGSFFKFYKLRQLLKFIGPAFIVSVAYIDPPIFVLEQ